MRWDEYFRKRSNDSRRGGYGLRPNRPYALPEKTPDAGRPFMADIKTSGTSARPTKLSEIRQPARETAPVCSLPLWGRGGASHEKTNTFFMGTRSGVNRGAHGIIQ